MSPGWQAICWAVAFTLLVISGLGVSTVRLGRGDRSVDLHLMPLGLAAFVLPWLWSAAAVA